MRHTLRSEDGGSKSHKGCPQPTSGRYELVFQIGRLRNFRPVKSLYRRVELVSAV